jgi:competence protein ComEC
MRAERKHFFKLSVLGAFFVATIFLIYFVYELRPKSYLEISFLNIGQGDSVLFQTPQGGKILIDGGPDKKVLSELGQALPIFSKNLDLVIATHDDADHIMGLIDVLKKYKVKVLLYSLPNSESPLSKELMRVAKERNVQVVQVVKPMFIRTEDGLVIKVMFPVKNMDNAESNDASVSTQFIFGKNKFLLTGDLPQSGEIFLVRRYGENLKSDLLKLGHHGSDTSTNQEFLQVVRPEVAVASDGKNNKFGHPHQSVLDLCEKFGIKVYRTDQEGRLNFYTNGLNIWKE